MARLAVSLVNLRSQANAWAPTRLTDSDGWIGDAAHASRPSRHNPNDAGVVCAIDLTHDPKNGFDVHLFARLLVAAIKAGIIVIPDLEYIISNDQTASRRNGWNWVAYKPNDPKRNKHIKHAHFAVGRGEDSEPTPPYDDITDWHVAELLGDIPPATQPIKETFLMALTDKQQEEVLNSARANERQIVLYVGTGGSKHYYVRHGIVAKHVPDNDTLQLLVAAGLPLIDNGGGGWSGTHLKWIAFLDGPLKNI